MSRPKPITGMYVYMTLLTIAVLYLLIPKAIDDILGNDLRRVRTYWEGSTLRMWTIQGLIEIDYLYGTSNGTPVVAKLDKPIFVIDSESVKLPYATMQKLSWQSEGGVTIPAPPVGSPIHGLYRRFDVSDFKEKQN